ncbi:MULTISPECIES: iron chaperone [Lactococcus]|uniref:iron chaperone n=1 Tax=Lactococcus TaxID=1357 RepID=UPI00203C5DD8|nr:MULTISPECIES: DUF1801 domain-containing protein [Lactococcus]
MTVEDYYATLDSSQDPHVLALRKLIMENAQVEEVIAWSMPTFKLKATGKNFLSIKATKKFVSLYIFQDKGGDSAQQEIIFDTFKDYAPSTGGGGQMITVRFDYKKDLPEQLLKDFIQFQVKAVTEK